MTLTINDTLMTSDQSAHTARRAPGRQHGWEVSWRLWPAVQSWAAELGLTGPDAIAQASQPPRDTTREPAARQPDREAAD